MAAEVDEHMGSEGSGHTQQSPASAMDGSQDGPLPSGAVRIGPLASEMRPLMRAPSAAVADDQPPSDPEKMQSRCATNTTIRIRPW